MNLRTCEVRNETIGSIPVLRIDGTDQNASFGHGYNRGGRSSQLIDGNGGVSRREIVKLIGLSAGSAAIPLGATPLGAAQKQGAGRSNARFHPPERAVGDVMPFYHDGEYHVFYLLNAAGNENINWEHVVSADLVHWRQLPPAIRRDPNDPTGPEGGCMFTGSVIQRGDMFHAFYTGWNPQNPKGREFICHATSRDLVNWVKHPEDMIGPDGIHYANHQARDFRDPCVVWDDELGQYRMYINANKPGKPGFIFGMLTSSDLKNWVQEPPIEGIKGDECPDVFRAGDTYYLHSDRRYAFSTQKGGPWQFPADDRIDRPMAAKRTFDGKRHMWFGGWLEGPMSIPREVFEGPDGSLFMKPADEIVGYFNREVFSRSDLALKPGVPWEFAVPDDYYLEASLLPGDYKNFTMSVRSGSEDHNSDLVFAPMEALIMALGGPYPVSRELPVDAWLNPVNSIQAFIVGGIAEVFLNSKHAATLPIGSKGSPLRIKSQGEAVLKTLRISVAR